MKSMTCRQLGGPCGEPLRGDTADDVIKAQDAHLKAAVDAGDRTHEPARSAMRRRWLHPKKSMDWYREAQRRFAGLPDD